MLKTLLIGAFALSSVVLVAETAKNEMTGLEDSNARYKELKSKEGERKQGRVTDAAQLRKLEQAIAPLKTKLTEYQDALTAADRAYRELPTSASKEVKDAAYDKLLLAESERDAAQAAAEKAETAFREAKSPRVEDKKLDDEQKELARQMEALKTQLETVKLEMKLSDLVGDKLHMDVKLEALERKADQLAVGGYVREKFARLLSDPAACKAMARCTAGPPLSRGEVNEQLNEVFFNNEGSLGRSRSDGSKKAAPAHQ